MIWKNYCSWLPPPSWKSRPPTTTTTQAHTNQRNKKQTRTFLSYADSTSDYCNVPNLCFQVCRLPYVLLVAFNTLRPRQNSLHFSDDIFKYTFLNEHVWILIKISLKFITKGLINNISALVQIMAWRRPGNKPLSEPIMVSLLHICITQPLWLKWLPEIIHNMHQWTGTSLVQVMTWHLFGTKPLPEPIMAYFELDSWRHISVKFESEFYHFHSRKCIRKCHLLNLQAFCPRGVELTKLAHNTHNHIEYIKRFFTYCQTSDIKCTLVGYKIVDHSDVVGASPVGTAPSTSSFST